MPLVVVFVIALLPGFALAQSNMTGNQKAVQASTLVAQLTLVATAADRLTQVRRCRS
jgi:hypothetical protein